MTNILCAVFGIVFIMLILPIIQTLSDVVCTFFQWAISNINVKIATNNIEIQKMQDSLVPENTNVIGFDMSNDDYQEDYEDDCEDNLKPKAKIGFSL